MSVIVTGMDMPKNCLECPCHDREYGHCHVDPNIDTYEGISDRPRRCPLVELKESQEIFNKDSATESMLNADLIDRQAAIEQSIVLRDISNPDKEWEVVTVATLKHLKPVQPEQKVIRCKDCNEWHRGKNRDGSDVYSDEGYCSVHRIITGENYYCGDAERR